MHEAQYESEVAEEDEAKDKAQIPNFHKPFKGQPNPDVFPRSPYWLSTRVTLQDVYTQIM
jgi:hypothetical protein